MTFAPDYPFPKLEYGETKEVAPGIHWIRMPLPFALNHINLWLLEDGDGWTLIDTGLHTGLSKKIWSKFENIFLRGGFPGGLLHGCKAHMIHLREAD